ncbi:hypothetical protein BCF53_12218 [Reinekea marinisedimentorum]|uniref:Tetratricopeptide repeat protein n=2 Tax=Reinekea marinisedimentorum TaxID=230495 RepID=A0A4R3HVF3_9GAMM|nr:hypothetical protein BCF53_12218 [Reinekea marinisedimentorum]
MKFLCPQHRSKLSGCPQRAMQFWQKTFFESRAFINAGDWNKALIYSGNALESAEIILQNQPTQMNAERYLQTAIDFALVLRNSRRPADLIAMYSLVADRMQPVGGSAERLQPLKDVLFEPLERVNEWVHQWHQMNELRSSPLH